VSSELYNYNEELCTVPPQFNKILQQIALFSLLCIGQMNFRVHDGIWKMPGHIIVEVFVFVLLPYLFLAYSIGLRDAA